MIPDSSRPHAAATGPVKRFEAIRLTGYILSTTNSIRCTGAL
jgi:hypothetical protein